MVWRDLSPKTVRLALRLAHHLRWMDSDTVAGTIAETFREFTAHC